MHKADFERLLAERVRMRSAHFAVHHLPGLPGTPPQPGRAPDRGELSTDEAPAGRKAVDNFSSAQWLGCIVPKRNARRAVTRNLLKRQMRGAFVRHASQLPAGLWLLRLRSGFPATEFVSARSTALARAAAAELDELLARGRG